MNPRAILLVLVCLAAVFAAYLLLLPGEKGESLEEQSAAFPVIVDEVESAPGGRDAGPMRAPFSFFEPGDVVEDESKPRLLRHYGAEHRGGGDDLRLVRAVIEQYWRMTNDPDSLTLGANEDVLRNLAGQNSLGIEFVSPDHEFLNTKGQLLDRWGQALYFHANSVTDIEIRSSGPDRKRYTDDDIVVRARTAILTKR